VHGALGEQQQDRRPDVAAPPPATPAAPASEAWAETRTEAGAEPGTEVPAETRTESGRATVPERATRTEAARTWAAPTTSAAPAKFCVLDVFHSSLLSHSIGLRSIDDISTIYPTQPSAE
jgi:hypothetical protein